MDHCLDIRPINKHKSQSNDSHSFPVKEFREVDFGKNPQNLQEEYLDVYEGIQSDIVSSNRFDENSDISTTYLGQIEQKGSQNKLKAEESFPISENCYTRGNYWMAQNVNYYWTQVQASPSCLNHFICTVNLCTLCQSLQQPHRKYK